MLDVAALDRLRTIASTPEAMGRLVASFLDNGASLVAQLADAAATGDIHVLRRHAHTLKSNAAIFRATDLADVCGRLEAKARVGDATNAPVLAAAIAAAFGGTREVLVQVVAP